LLKNEIASKIYKIDSFNLIIGDNGAGKTSLIKAIIRDLLDESKAQEFVFERSGDELGLIYYTSTPFSSPMTNVRTPTSAFIDASKSAKENTSFLQTAKEYIGVCKSLGIKRPLISMQAFDFSDAAFQLAQCFLSTPKHRSTAVISTQVLDAYKAYFESSSFHERLIAQKQSIEHEKNSSKRVARNQFSDDDLKNQIINEDLIKYAKLTIKCRTTLEDAFIYEYGPRNKRDVLQWIIACYLLAEPVAENYKTELAGRIIHKDWDALKQNEIGKTYGILYPMLNRFTSMLVSAAGSGFESSRAGAVFKVNIDNLLKEKFHGDDIELAYKYGFLRIGFNKMSSGEAAILHQLTSISHAIHEQISNNISSIVIFIDEADMLLHLRWQRKYIELLDSRLGALKKNLKIKSIQVILATHSPLLATEILRESITRLGKNGETPSFGASLQKIVNYSFNTPTIGSLVEKKIRALQKKVKYDKNDLAIIDQIDDEFTRKYLLLEKAV